ncbi:MAG: sodium-dependent transporter [Candidatus Marinimicrobia bacterium]|jgi:NSS family neurotransmitter:Na+ symporter|nr:sodium-dependent transporter [Candidatus Neomarinimicrobiota bacterium]MBT3946139.1 sodium-dependent transporter [Candidatus Neomarinimicrobiota bacterium]MBT4154486.1 sodium-dependent transporter [Candidatus Neomarinimicrobiota bacterium]MBT4555132.1 sodium-dependent transporter [Candidatus Neomarinimicrobiota bacterium]MBT4752560.1 sodium-dependent transporter [Candidatus Neomarinimicrobiota bacterium]
MQNREQWGSRLGFILAASGSAVGLGNIWKFPHMAGENGGGAFTFVYLICILVVGLPIVIAEFVIGRKTQLSPVGAFETIAPKSNWKWVGMLGVASAFVILSFYGVVGGWTLKYTLISLTGGFNELAGNPELSGKLFTNFISGSLAPILWQVIFMAITIVVIIQGVKGGIEKWTKVMMPAILIILIMLMIRGLTLPNGMQAIDFLFKPKFDDLTASSIVLALGHSFFTLSLGMGTMITYGSYLRNDQNLLSSALWIIFLDTVIALMAGVAIFATVFAMGANPGEGAGLIFVVLPTIFPEIAGGAIWGTLFFFLLFMAALTSAISILEVITAYFIDEKGWSRQKATIIFGSVITGVGALCSLSMGTYNITALAGMSFFDVLDYLSSKYMLPIGGMLTGVFVLVRWGIPNFISEMVVGMKNPKVNATFVRILFLVSATVVGFILINEIIATITGTPIIG